MNARPNLAGVTATSPKALAYQPSLEPCDDADWLSELSFADLLDMRDTASEEDDWRGMEEIDGELRGRRSEATAQLTERFIDAVDGRAFILVVSGGVISAANTREYLTEVLGTKEATELAVRMALGERDAVVKQLAADYARDNADDLLRAGAEL